MAVGNVRTAGHTSQDLLRGYLTWAIEAERMLRNHFTSDSISSLIFTPRYWALQTTGANNWELARALVEAEINEQSERLLREKALLDEAQSRWMWGGVLIVIDTSAIIHGPELWAWDPADDFGLHDETIQIVVPILVLDELDALKESTKQHTRNRARKTLRWMSEILGSREYSLIRDGHRADKTSGSPARGDVHLDVLLDEPGHVRLPIADDEIVDRAASIASVSGRQVTVVTNDVGQAYRSRLAGLEARTIKEPTYDVDLQEAARESAKIEKRREIAQRRAEQEAARGKRRTGSGEAAKPTEDA